MILAQRISTGYDFAPSPDSPWELLAMTGHNFGCQNCMCGGTAPGIYMMGPRGAPKYPTMHRLTPTAKNYLDQNVNIANVEKSCNV